MPQPPIRIRSADGAEADLILVGEHHPVFLLWLPAMGVPARHYRALADVLDAQGIGVALHEWRGIGSSDQRARRGRDWDYATLLDDVSASLIALRSAIPHASIWIGGHSLGGQIAALSLAEQAQLAGLVIAGAGVPDWRCFPPWKRGAVRLMFLAARVLSTAFGYFPGRRTGFAGNEAKSVMQDWARSGEQGHYAAIRPGTDLPGRMRTLTLPVLGLQFRSDPLIPRESMLALFRLMPACPSEIADLDEAELGGPADHFSWMKQPLQVAERIADFLREQRAARRDPTPRQSGTD